VTGAPPVAVRDRLPAASGTVPVVPQVLRIVAIAAGRLLWWWPGVVVTFAAYLAVSLAVYGRSYPNLWGLLGAGAVAVAWYASPLRNAEARRRRRLRSRQEVSDGS